MLPKQFAHDTSCSLHIILLTSNVVCGCYNFDIKCVKKKQTTTCNSCRVHATVYIAGYSTVVVVIANSTVSI